MFIVGKAVDHANPALFFNFRVMLLQVRKSLMNAPSKGVISLPKDIHWLGNFTFTEDIYVRPCYNELLAARDAYREAGCKFATTLFTGTPGARLAQGSSSFICSVSMCAETWSLTNRNRQVPLCRADGRPASCGGESGSAGSGAYLEAHSPVRFLQVAI